MKWPQTEHSGTTAGSGAESLKYNNMFLQCDANDSLEHEHMSNMIICLLWSAEETCV